MYVAGGNDELEQRKHKRQPDSPNFRGKSLRIGSVQPRDVQDRAMKQVAGDRECPYGEHYQFAHGFDELLPVISDPSSMLQD